MSVWRSFLFGLGRVLKTPSLLCWVYLASLAVALPLAMVVRGGIAAHVGGSLVEQNLRTGLDLDWYGEFAEEASGVAATFGPEVIGHMALVQNLERLLDGKLLAAHRTLLAAGGLYLLFWTFLVGGILDRFAHPGEPHSRARLFGHSGEFFWRMFRLLILSVPFSDSWPIRCTNLSNRPRAMSPSSAPFSSGRRWSTCSPDCCWLG